MRLLWLWFREWLEMIFLSENTFCFLDIFTLSHWFMRSLALCKSATSEFTNPRWRRARIGCTSWVQRTLATDETIFWKTVQPSHAVSSRSVSSESLRPPVLFQVWGAHVIIISGFLSRSKSSFGHLGGKFGITLLESCLHAPTLKGVFSSLRVGRLCFFHLLFGLFSIGRSANVFCLSPSQSFSSKVSVRVYLQREQQATGKLILILPEKWPYHML